MDRLDLRKISEISGVAADRIELFDFIGSTNDCAKADAKIKPALFAVAAECQTAGRGRHGRSFFSPDGAGLYLSVLVRAPLTAKQCMLLTPYAAVAVSKAIWEVCRVNTGIKWVNDLQIRKKKVCGILTEPTFSSENGLLQYAVVGIGINTGACEFPPELRETATSVENESAQSVDRNQLCGQLLSAFKEITPQLLSDSIAEYRRRSVVIGRPIRILCGKEVYDAVCTGIGNDGSLEIRTASGIERLTAGEITIRVQ